MIITNRFAFIHLHKTGGQSLNDIIGRCIADHRIIGYHFPRAELPPEARDLPVVGMVRNPWDWYVSWYAFNKRPGALNPLFHVVSNGGTARFKETAGALIRLSSDRPESARMRDALVRLLPDSLDGNRGVGLTTHSMRELCESGAGYYSWLFKRMLGDTDDGRTFIGRFENLRDDFINIMDRLQVEQTDALREALDCRERKNVSRHTHYSHYYDDELRDLVADQESALIEKYGYRFDCMKPAGVAYEFRDDLLLAGNAGFRKLLGREKNFLRLNEHFDVAAIRSRIEQLPAGKWLESERERLFDVHRDTQALLMVHFEDYQYEKPEYRELYAEMRHELEPVIEYIANYYKNNGFVVRLILAKLVAGGKIPRHTDAGFSLLNSHRIHLPIITNEDVVFFVGGEELNMRAGELWEINNGTVHGVENRGAEDRIHLIVDWMPNEAGKSVEDALTADALTGTDSEAANTAMLASIVQRAHQQHQAGEVGKAEALYRQVLHFDANHVIANNLLGLLCLQTRRFDEAAKLIGTALAVRPDDSQAHSNLGLALNALDRPEEAAAQFHESLKRDPANPRVYNNLGNVYVRLRRVMDAVRCYEQALAISPGIAEVHHNLGSALLQLRRYPEAAASLQQCLALQPGFEEAQTKLEQALAAHSAAGSASGPAS